MAPRRRSTATPPRRPVQRVTYDVVRKLALALPGTEEGTSYGTPAIKVGGKLLVRLREDGETLALRIGFLERQEWMASDPEAFFITDHYLKYPAVVVHLGKVRRDDLREVLADSWRSVAPNRLVAEFDGAQENRASGATPKTPKTPRTSRRPRK